MATQSNSSDSGSSFWLQLIILGAVIGVFMTPLEMVQHAMEQQRENVAAVIGDDDEEAIFALATAAADVATSSDFIDEVHDGIDAEHAKAADFLSKKVAAFREWGVLFTYRLQINIAWLVVLLPMAVASLIDGFYSREIRKTKFVAQSPLRHKNAVRFSKAVSVIIPLEMAIPIATPPILMPIFLIGAMFATWTWVTHLQKRT